MAVSINCKNNPLSPIWGRQPPVAQAVGDRDLSIKFFIFKQIPGGDATAGGLSPVGRATGCSRDAWLTSSNSRGRRTQASCMGHSLLLLRPS